MILSMKTQNIDKDFKKLEDIFNFSNLNENHELFSNKNKKDIGKFSIETHLKRIIMDEFTVLRSKMYAFNLGGDSKNKVRGISKSYSKNIKFEEYKKCLNGEKYQEEFVNYILRSINHEMFLQKTKKIFIVYFRW